MRVGILAFVPALSLLSVVGCAGSAEDDVENRAPSAPTLSLGPTDARTDDDLVVSIRTEAADPDGDPVSYGYAWFQNGVLRSDITEGTVPASETTKGDLWEVTVTPNDGALDGTPATASITVQNSLPVASLSLIPESPNTDEDLRVVATVEDADGEAVTLAYVWTVEGQPTEYAYDTVPASATERGERWAVTVTPSDPEVAGLPAVAEASIANSAPEVLAVSLSPEQPYVTDDVVASVTGADADGDAIAYDYRWFVDGVEVQRGPSDTLPAGSFAKHQLLSVEVTPNDGVVDGAAFDSVDAVAINSLPSASAPSIDPAAAYESSTLSCLPAGFTDADADPEGWTYSWSVNGRVAGSASTLDGTAFDKGDRVACAATPVDGEASGDAVTSAEVIISNTAPVLSSVALSTYAPTENDTLSVSIGAVIDDDGDTVGYGYAWYVNGTVAGTTSTLAATRFAKGDDIYVVVTPWDGTSYGSPATSAVATGTNTAPTITRVTLSPSTVYTDSTITASVVSSDLDGDAVTFTYDWYVDGYPRGSSTSATLSGSGYFDKGQEVYVVVTPNDGDADGTTSTSSVVTVANSAPTAPVVEITPGDAVDGDDLTCTVVTPATDADGDAVTYTFDWEVDGVAYTGATDGAASSVVDGGDVGVEESWACSVRAGDGADVGSSGLDDLATGNACGNASVRYSVGDVDFVKVCGGTFSMGCTSGAGACESDETLHTVTLTSDYFVSQTEITQDQFDAQMGYNPSYFASCGGTCPVEMVSWHMAAAYANALSAAEGLSSCYTCSGSGTGVSCAVSVDPYDCSGYRLLTEAEWENGARCGMDTTYAGSNSVTAVAWYSGNSAYATHEVGGKTANACGLYDMSGNVWEWTQDWYGTLGSSAVVDPVGAASGTYRSYRGGSWVHDPSVARLAYRGIGVPSVSYYDLGFRLARTVP